jgi:hypothetical protein
MFALNWSRSIDVLNGRAPFRERRHPVARQVVDEPVLQVDANPHGAIIIDRLAN